MVSNRCESRFAIKTDRAARAGIMARYHIVRNVGWRIYSAESLESALFEDFLALGGVGLFVERVFLRSGSGSATTNSMTKVT